MIDKILKSRTFLMGIATLMVIFYHIFTNFGNEMVPYIARLGYSGVDIFLFLSGLGLSYGFRKYDNVWKFLKKRAMRIYPTYLVVVVIASLDAFSLTDVLVQSIGIGFFMPNSGIKFYEWYIPTVYALYLIFPLIFKLIDRNLLWSIPLLFISLLPIALKLNGSNIAISNLALVRVPIFVVGIFLGLWNQKSTTLNAKGWELWSFLSVIAFIAISLVINRFSNFWLWNTMAYWIPFIIITPGLCLALAHISEKMSSWIFLSFEFIGSLSIEVYLMHCLILDVSKNLIMPLSNVGKFFAGIAFLAVSILLAYMLNLVISRIMLLVNFQILQMKKIIGHDDTRQ